MEQQFEHLSDAQIESYGESMTGRAPGQRDREGDPAVETHLAACGDCRTRVLEHQRSRLGIMSSGYGSPERRPSNPDRYADPAAPHNDPGSADCPTEASLRDLAAGLADATAAAQLTRHAAQCDRCGPLLRAYTEDFADDLSAEDQALLNQLNSASPSWQKKMARQMANAVSSEAAGAKSAEAAGSKSYAAAPARALGLTGSSASTSATAPGGARHRSAARERFPFRLPSPKWIFVPATAVAAILVAFLIWNSRRVTPEKVEKLLAQAYTEQRTMEMRWPGAEYADFRQTRSGDSGSRLNLPTSLNGATEAISKHLDKNPDDPKWLMLSARLDLLDWRYKPALSTLERITDTQVLESPEFLMTRSLALYEKSEASKESQGYFEAVNLLARALQKTPNDPVLLFNQAIACERIHSYECAKRDWDRFLGIEKDQNWTAEARKHLDQIDEKKNLAP